MLVSLKFFGMMKSSWLKNNAFIFISDFKNIFLLLGDGGNKHETIEK